MATDDVMQVDERLSRLETTVANGFFENGRRIGRVEARMDRLDDRMSALASKIDIFADGIRGDLKTVLEAVTAGTEEMRRTTEAIRKEHEADRRLTRSILDDHSHRLRIWKAETQPPQRQPLPAAGARLTARVARAGVSE